MPRIDNRRERGRSGMGRVGRDEIPRLLDLHREIVAAG
jgi:hypothetical protein